MLYLCCVHCSRSLSLYMRQFVCSVVVGRDFVPRLGIITLDSLKRQMQNELNSCRLPKVAFLLCTLDRPQVTALFFCTFIEVFCSYVSLSDKI